MLIYVYTYIYIYIYTYIYISRLKHRNRVLAKAMEEDKTVELALVAGTFRSLDTSIYIIIYIYICIYMCVLYVCILIDFYVYSRYG